MSQSPSPASDTPAPADDRSARLPPDLLPAERVALDLPAGSKKKALEEIARLLAVPGKPPGADQIYEKILERERLGSTGLGRGFALPHARIRGLRNPRGALLRLAEAVDFAARDDEPVDLVFGLLVPEQAEQVHLDLLARLARLFSDTQCTSAVRNAAGVSEILALLNTPAAEDESTDQRG